MIVFETSYQCLRRPAAAVIVNSCNASENVLNFSKCHFYFPLSHKLKNDYDRTSSVTKIMEQLGWSELTSRRHDLRLLLFYRIVYIAVPTTDILIPADTRTRSKH